MRVGGVGGTKGEGAGGVVVSSHSLELLATQ